MIGPAGPLPGHEPIGACMGTCDHDELLVARFESKFTRGTPENCWRWEAAVNSAGYGVLNGGPDKGIVYAHRLSYELVHGEIAEGLHVHHQCRNRWCINPNHLEALTPLEHAQHNPSVTRTHCIHGHPRNEANTYVQPKSGYRTCLVCMTCRNRARKFKKAAA